MSFVGRKTRGLLRFALGPALAGVGILHVFAQNTGPPEGSPTIGSTKFSENGKVMLVYVPAGEFAMGSETGNPNEKPLRTIYLDAYWIGKNDVTVAQFRAFCKDSGTRFDWDSRRPPAGWLDSHPMENVTWDEARAFCRWAGGDLPTEAQWEKAARGTDGRRFPWGNEWDGSKCACKESSILPGTQPVGSYPAGASPYGCLDMAGNVWQWCRDRYADKAGPLATRNPTGPSSGELRVLRGGAWSVPDNRSFRTSCRTFCRPGFAGNDCFGFRVSCLAVAGSR